MKMTRKYPLRRIREEFEPDLQPLSDLGREMIAFRARIEDLRVHKCLLPGDRRPFGYFFSVLEDGRWRSYAAEVQQSHRHIEDAILKEIVPKYRGAVAP